LINWRFDMDAAPRDGTSILAWFPLENLSSDWCRAVPVYWSEREGRWNFASRAASGFSRCYEPTAWSEISEPVNTDAKETAMDELKITIQKISQGGDVDVLIKLPDGRFANFLISEQLPLLGKDEISLPLLRMAETHNA